MSLVGLLTFWVGSGADYECPVCVQTTPGYIANTAVIDETNGPVIIGDNTRICHGAVLQGPLCIGRDCLVGNNAFIRAGSMLGDRVRIGFSTEVDEGTA
ncbi:hypothetical protein G3E01_004583 [Salmonella enterica subsp. enterica]|nr:hypothetical protein [Salmonella enterica subsp. enterica]